MPECPFHMGPVKSGEKTTMIEGSNPPGYVTTTWTRRVGKPDATAPCQAALCALGNRPGHVEVNTTDCKRCARRQMSRSSG
ncbi:MAG TPA: hypothetical protein VEW42_00630 [Candidatus Eisenbacteria bacterium]|nr:hypothetical protein [Candidatus Eisenbacteria bacterium]